MKNIQLWFNKNSRFAKTHNSHQDANTPSSGKLLDFSPDDLQQRLGKLLKKQNDFFPCFDWTFPPPLLNKHEPVTTAHELFCKPSVIPGRYSIYLHSPFCKSLCSFCYYAVIPGKGIDMSASYVDYLCREMALYAEQFRGQVCESIYFGGGTPSFLDDRLLGQIFENLHRHFNIDSQAEITLEAAPGTLPLEKSYFLKSLGVNRLSYGIQTLNEELLASMNRDYSVKQALTELTHAVDILGNVNVDTMYGFEGESDDTLIKTLSQFHSIGVPCFSIYSLDKQRTEYKTSFEPPKDTYYEHKIRLFAAAENYLKSRNYVPVLQNIFVDPARASYRHQLRRWDNLPLLALGIGSQGYAPQRPYQNTGSMKSYYHLIDEGKLPLATMDKLDAELELCRELTSKLRFTHVSIGEFKYKYGVDISQVFHHLINALQNLDFVQLKNDVLRMTSKAAYYNNIIPMLFAPDNFKEKLMSLPEEYLETFPVPYAMTQLGRSQTTAICFDDSSHIVNADRRRRMSPNETTQTSHARMRNGHGRRSSDRIQGWSTLSEQ
ncbi:MAG TPA: coproporphyrinogen-III oxidase family protein [Gammaproteobacteria bacterium]|nr:coproporphyrinogen-III oxidase family protein [Gammaproteobacteria bacterium]